ncbi:MAG TPA: nucleoid-associated protein [Clostridiales bacterium]|nr:nucleoid-associated protein [Clostridiales bacterium]
MGDKIILRKAILHILDTNIDIPVLSNTELELDSDICDFLEKHIEKLLDDPNMKIAEFLCSANEMGETNYIRDICANLAKDAEYFYQASFDITNILFNILIKNVDIAPADLICCLFDYCRQSYLGILKLNYKTSFTHFVQQCEEGNINTIIKHRTILPSESQKIDECAFVNLQDLSIKLIEKAYEINGEKELYFSRLFLCCSPELSDNEKLKIIDKVTKKINKKFFDEDFDKVAKLKKVVSENLEESNSIQVDTIIEKVFDNNIEIQNEYVSEIQKEGLLEKSISVPEKLAEKKFKTHKIKTDTGIEISFPPSYYSDNEKIEFINNPDGTISIIIKNIGKIVNR